MQDLTERIQARLSRINADIKDLERRFEEEDLQQLADLIAQTPQKGRPGEKRRTPSDRGKNAGAMTALYLYRLRGELDLLCQDPSLPHKETTASLVELVRWITRIQYGARPDRESIVDTGYLLSLWVDTGTPWQRLLECLPLRYRLILQQEEKNEGDAQQHILEEMLGILYTICSGCARWNLTQEGVGILRWLEKTFREILGDSEVEQLLNQILMEQIDKGNAAFAAAYGDSAREHVEKVWQPLHRGDFFWGYGTALYNLKRWKESAKAFFQCWKLREQTLAPDGLYTLLARAIYIYVSRLLLRQEFHPGEVDFLVGFLEQVLEHHYRERPLKDQMLLVGNLIFGVLGQLPRRGILDKTGRLLELYCNACEQYDTDASLPYYNRRYAFTMAGVQASADQNYNQALEYMLRARETPSPDDGAGEPWQQPLDEETLDYNVAYLTSMQGNLAEGIRQMKALLDRMQNREGRRNEEIYLRASMVYYSELLLAGKVTREEAVQMRRRIHEEARAIRASDGSLPWDDAGKLRLAPCASILELLYDGDMLRTCDLPDAIAVARRLLQILEGDPLYQGVYATILYLLAVLLWRKGSPECLELCRTCMKMFQEVAVPDRIRAACTTAMAAIQKQYAGSRAAAPYARVLLQELDSQWKSSVRTLNDRFLTVTMNNARGGFSVAYCILREELTERQAFELVLRYKALASLAGRERNRILTSMPGADVQEALEQLHTLQNRQAVVYTMPPQEVDREQADRVNREIARLSAEVERAMPGGCFTEITFDALARKLPEGAAIVEYYWAVDGISPVAANGEKKEPRMVQYPDVYVMRRAGGQVTLCRRTLENCDLDAVNNDCEAFYACCADGTAYADRAVRARKNELRNRLYRTLIRPVEDLLQGAKTLYIAPEEVLRNFPYGLLGSDENDTLDRRYTVAEMICSRDLLFDSGDAMGGACVVGDPAYLAGRTAEERESDPFSRGKAPELHRLPFSRAEAKLVAGYTSGRCLTGQEASKGAVEELAGRYGILHIATHGDFDDTGTRDALFRARIYLAGAQNFLSTGRETERYGNGILTADEISRMNLHGTWLAVLSACFTGKDEATDAGNVEGLVSAFGAAGVRCVVTSLWEADDFATVELMRRFYQQLGRNCQPPEALRRAKQSLAQATVAELRRSGWEDLLRTEKIPSRMREALETCLAHGDGFRPFANEHYWGGFVCHLCRGEGGRL